MSLQVFPAGRFCSVRRVLLLWLLPVFVLVGGLSATATYWGFDRMVSAFMDDQMVLLAESLSGQGQDVPLPAHTRERAHKWGGYAVQVFEVDGRVRSSTLPDVALALQPEDGFHDVRAEGARWRVLTVPAADTAGQRRVQVVQSIEFRKHLSAGRAGGTVIPVIILLVLSVGILWGVVAMVSRAVGDIARQAKAQDEHSIAELPMDHVPREIAPLVVSFNGLLARLRDAFATQRRFVQDAAHELRTPIAAVGLQLENLRGDLAGGASAQRFAQLEAGVQRAQRLVDQLLRLSRQQSAPVEAGPQPVDVHAVLRESINTLIALADQRRIDLGLVDAAEPRAPVLLTCQSSDLRSVLDNLIENALRYTPEGGVVDVRVGQEQGGLVIEVADTGPGIPDELLGRVFDRFFRVPGTDTRGSGLGLAIAQAAAQRCGLQVSLHNRKDRQGLVARLAAVP